MKVIWIFIWILKNSPESLFVQLQVTPAEQ